MIEKCKYCYSDIDSEDTKLLDNIKEYQVPFVCEVCGGLKFPYQALKGIVFVWPKPIPETQGAIYIPDRVRAIFKTSYGMVMSTGPGCIEKRTGIFVPAEVIPGDILSYNNNIPWQIEVPDANGKKHTIDMMNVLDVEAIIEDDKYEKQSVSKGS